LLLLLQLLLLVLLLELLQLFRGVEGAHTLIGEAAHELLRSRLFIVEKREKRAKQRKQSTQKETMRKFQIKQQNV
jgi:hypothetical protein